MTETSLPDGDYTLADDGIWITAGVWSVRVFANRNDIDETILEVAVYPLGKEGREPIDCIALSDGGSHA